MKFLYQAKNQQGQIIKGEVKARNREAALTTLQNANLIVISLVSQKDVPIFAKQLKIFSNPNLKDIAIFTRQLAVLVESKVPLIQSLRSLLEQTKKAGFAEVIFIVASDVEAGAQLSDALAKHKKVFSDLYVSMVRAGETSGTLDKSLLYLAEHLEQEYDIRNKIKNAMIYPAFILVSFIVVVILMMLFVFPKITALLQNSGQELPIITRIIIDLTIAFRTYWWALLILLFGAIIAFVLYRKTPAGKNQIDYFKIKVPIFGQLFQKIYMARFSENLATLIAGGIPIIRSLQVVSKVVANKVYEKIIVQASDKIKVGESMHSVFKKSKYMPSTVTEMIKVGESSGQLDTVLSNLARFYTREVNNSLSSLTELIQPILIVIMGVGVAFVVLSILMPIYNMVTAF